MSSLVVEVREPRGKSVKVSEEGLTVDLVDGRTIMVPLGWFPRLWHGTPQERNHFEIFGDGAYIHWPDLDEDIRVEDLLAGRPSGESQASLRRWLRSRAQPRRKRARSASGTPRRTRPHRSGADRGASR